MSILLVEDHRYMREILRSVLVSLGIRHIRESVDGWSALEELKEFEANAIILDNKMANMGGVELTRRIRMGEGGANPFVPIIMVSAYSDIDSLAEARDSGISEFLAKPISAKLMYLRLQSAILKPRNFIRTEDFYGPDRRRRRIDTGQPDRRAVPFEYHAPQRLEARA